MRRHPDRITVTRKIVDAPSPNAITTTSLTLTLMTGTLIRSPTHTPQSHRSAARPSSPPHPHYHSQRPQAATRRTATATATAATAAAAGRPTSARSCGPRASCRGACCPPRGGRPRASAGRRAARETTIATTTTGAAPARTTRKRKRKTMKTAMKNYAVLSTTVTTAADLQCRGGGKGAGRAPNRISSSA